MQGTIIIERGASLAPLNRSMRPSKWKSTVFPKWVHACSTAIVGEQANTVEIMEFEFCSQLIPFRSCIHVGIKWEGLNRGPRDRGQRTRD